MSERIYRIAYCIKTKRPACVLLEAVYGCDRVARRFPTRSWIVGEGIEGLEFFRATESQLKRLIEITEAAHPEPKRA